MRKPNGIDAAKRIGQDSTNSRVVFLSRNSNREGICAGLMTGAARYVLKANTASDPLPTIAAALGDGR